MSKQSFVIVCGYKGKVSMVNALCEMDEFKTCTLPKTSVKFMYKSTRRDRFRCSGDVMPTKKEKSLHKLENLSKETMSPI